MEFVAELGPCEGDFEYAIRGVSALAGTGIAMKVQWYTADTLAHRTAERYDRTDSRDIGQHEMFQQQLRWDQWRVVAAEAHEMGVDFFPTVFSLEAVRVAEETAIDRLKIASGDITFHRLIRAAAGSAERLVISTGASTMAEVEAAVEAAREANPQIDLTILACHLAYPTADADANLLRILSLQQRFTPEGVKVGYSDHTPQMWTIPILTAYQCAMWEKHVTLMGPGEKTEGDHTFAITVDSMKRAQQWHRVLVETLGDPTLAPTQSEMAARHGARRGTYAARDIRKGERIGMIDVEFLRPAEGVSPAEFEQREGELAMVDIKEGEPINAATFGSVGATLSVE